MRKIIWNWDRTLANTILAALVILTFAGVIFRYVFNRPILWLEEVQVMAIVWVIFLGSCVAFREDGHVVVEILVEMFPKGIQNALEKIISLIVIIILAFSCYLSYRYVMVFVKNGRLTSILRIPYYYVYSIVPLSFVWMIISFIHNLLARKENKV